MLERLVIHNFQCHRKLVIDFDPHCTVIVGSSDVGKSSILRALRLACFNLPSGTSFISHDADECRITLKVDGHKVTRTRGKATNEYALDGKVFKAFGQGNVPEEIEQLLNVGDINWQRQHDPPFWFSLTAGQVSKELNAIINLGLIDDALASVASELRKARSTEDVTWQRLAEAEQRKTELAWVVNLDERLTALEQLYTKKDEVALKRSQIEHLIDNAAEYENNKVSRSRAISAAAIVLQTCSKAAETTKRRKELEMAIQSYKEREDYLCRLKKDAANSSIELREQMKGKCPVCGSNMT